MACFLSASKEIHLKKQEGMERELIKAGCIREIEVKAVSRRMLRQLQTGAHGIGKGTGLFSITRGN